jgi:pSer/pThr/pTyr-binding forkhead associated (FHA) protein
MQAVLVMFRSDGERRSFSLTRDITVIGRREDCDLRIPLGEISRKHCRLVRDGDTFRLEDLGSSNGTFHNGQRVQEVALGPGDSVQVGPIVFVLQIDGVPPDDELTPITAQRAATQASGADADHGAPRPSAAGEAAADELELDDAALEPMQLDEDEDEAFNAVLEEARDDGSAKLRLDEHEESPQH